MATAAHANAVKSLNKSSGSRRFVFKSVAQRIEEIQIDVYRSLDKIKVQPSEGSTFFKDCLVEWRELNTAEDFISFYEQMMPLVQTLPLLLLHKELIFSELISRLQMKARLSLEPILRLIAALSRDLLEDFIPFFPRIVDSFTILLESGADREPEIIEQIFTSWSYIMMYLQKYLVKDVVHVLKVTAKLRYYTKSYIQEIMAVAISFLLRNAPFEQLEKGIKKILRKVVKKSLVEQKSGVSNLLYHIMKGTSSSFHSKADRVLQILTESSVLTIGDQSDQGLNFIIEVVTTTFQRLCEDIEPKELKKLWDCLYMKIENAINDDYRHLSFLLSLLISIVQIRDGRMVDDYKPMILLVKSMIQKFIVPSSIVVEEDNSEVIYKVMQLMLCIIDGLKSLNSMSTISRFSSQWAPVFALRTSSCLAFIRDLLMKDQHVVCAFRANILSALNDLVEREQEDVVCLLLSFCEKLQENPLSSSLFDGTCEEGLSSICGFLQERVRSWVELVKDIALGNPSCAIISIDKMAQLWAVICCYPHMMDIQKKPSLLMDLIDGLDRLLTIEDETIAGVSKCTWQSLLGAALDSYYKCVKESALEDTSKILRLAKTFKSSLHVLSSTAEYLDSMFGATLEADNRHRSYHPEFEKAVDALGTFADNLCNPDKGIRVPTLRILCHYQSEEKEISADDLHPEKRLKTEVPCSRPADVHSIDVLQLLLSIETTPLSISMSRKVILLVSKIQMGLSVGRICKTYLPIVLSGMIGVFHNRFSSLWNPASECLAVLIRENATLLWEKFIVYFEKCLFVFQSSLDKVDVAENTELPSNCNELVERFNFFAVPPSDNTPHGTVLSSLLQTLQKIPAIAESHSRQVVPLFFKFLGYDNDNLLSVGLFSPDVCKGKEWRGILKEWLNLFRLMRNPKAFYRSQFLKEVLLSRLMDENDADIQMRALDCLITWKDDFLLPYEQHLRNLISSKHLREQLTTWSLSRESLVIAEAHRAQIVPLIIYILIPKVRKPKILASRKHTSAHHRKAVLRFIAELDVNEISLFFALLIKPLNIVSKDGNATIDMFWTSPGNSSIDLEPLNILKNFTLEKIMASSWKKKYGFLHVIEDILAVFDGSHVRPFLDLLVGCVVRVLASCTSSLDAARSTGSSLAGSHSTVDIDLRKQDSTEVKNALTSTSLKQLKDLRSLCLKIVSSVLNKYDDHDFGNNFWDMFFVSVKPLVNSFKQEGSSSEKPSSLFSCFLAMSSSHHLVSLLSRERNLVPDIFSILSITNASEAIRSCVLKFIENLLNLDEELNEDNMVKRVLLLNLDELVSSLHRLFHGDGTKKRKFAKYPEETCIRIFKLLSKYIQDKSQSTKFLDVLLPLLTKRSKDSGICVDCLHIIQEIIPLLGSEGTSKILNAISPLLISVELDMRLNICSLFDALAKIDPSVLFVAKLLHELNAISATEMGGLDFDTVVNAYEKIDVGLFDSVPEDHALVVLSHCVYDMSSDELILRHSAYRSLLSFVEFAATILGGTADVEHSWSKACIQSIINKFLLKHMGNAMKEGSSVRKEWIELLRDMVLKLPEVENLNSLKALCSADAEQDFFNNIIHLQKHRRAKALLRFSNIIGKSKMPEGIMNRVFVPLFFKMLLDVQGRKGEHLKASCIEALTSIASQMEWKSYYGLLVRCFREMKMNLDKQKVLLRLVCSMLDQFHFSQSCSSQGDRNSSENTLGSDSTKTGPLAALRRCSSSSVIATEVQACLHKTVLPMMQKLLDYDSDKVNVNVNVAVLKVLKLLPGEVMDSQLPTIVHRIAKHLKNRLESIRDEARLALAACLKELGLEYLQFIVGVLRAILKRGYELHVLGYTLNFILVKFFSTPISGKLNYCLEDLLSVVENDILGDVAEEKEVEKIASKMKETRKLKSFETLKIIAQNITFKSHSLKLISPVKAYMEKHLTPKLKTKLESMLNHIAAGIECNPSVDQTDLFIFIYGFVEDGINEENGQGVSSGTELMPHSRHDVRKRISSAQVVGTKSGCSHLITVFSLGLFHNRMKSVKLDKNDNELLSMLDPFVKLLSNCLSSRYEDTISASLRCLMPLLRLPLPSLVSHADKIKVTLLEIAQSCSYANSSLMNPCLKLLTVLLRSTKITLSSDQLYLLIQFPLFVDLESNPSFVALSLLKAVVSRKLVVPEIYDLMIRVAELMVRSQMDAIRKKCSQISLQFLLDYHLSGTYLQQHFDFLLKNLSYEHSTGREAILEMLHAIIMKFPKTFLDKHAQTVFIHLVQCLVNDSDSKVRAMTGTVIKLLIGQVSPHLLDSMLDFSLSWYVDEKRQLRSTGAQAMGLLVEVMKKRFQKYIVSILPVSKIILRDAVDVVKGRPSLDPSEELVPFWKEAYYSLVLLEKILQQFQDLSFKKDLEDMWEAVSELLLHPHPWLRNISSRLVAFYFATATAMSRENHEKPLETFLLMRPHRLFKIAASFCCQLRTQVFDDAAENLITQNLVFTVCVMHSLMGKVEHSDIRVFWTSLESHEQGLFLNAFQLLESRKGKGVFLNIISGALDQDVGDEPENLRCLLISNLIKEMGKIALQMEAIQMKIVFNTFRKISVQINQDELQRYAYDLVLPLYKVCEGFAGKVIADDLKQLAQDVSESMRNALGIQNFVQVYSEIRKNIKHKREKRKKEEKVMAVVNPVRNAKRKLRIAAKNRAHKKRKIMTMKMGRLMR